MYIYIHIYIYIYILKRLPPLPPTSTQTRGFHDDTIRCFGVCCNALVPFVLHWSSQGAQIS